MITVTERDRLIERYMAGEMTASEEREFLNRAAADKQLGSLLEAERAILGGTRKERNRIPTVGTEPGAHLLAKLASTPAMQAPQVAASGSTIFSNGTVQAAIVAVGLLGIIIGAFLLAPLLSPNEELLPQQETQAPAQRMTPSPAPGIGPQGSEKRMNAKDAAPSAAPATTVQPKETGNNNIGAGKEKGEHALTRENGGAVHQRSEQSSGTTAAPKETATEKAFPLDDETSDPTVFDNDTVRFEMQIGTRKNK